MQRRNERNEIRQNHTSYTHRPFALLTQDAKFAKETLNLQFLWKLMESFASFATLR